MTDCKKWEERIADRASDSLTEPDRREVEVHLSTCASCRQAAHEYERVLELYRGIETTEPSDDVSRHILSLATTETATTDTATASGNTQGGNAVPNVTRMRSRSIVATLAAAALLAVTWLVLDTLSGGQPTAPAAAERATLVADGDRLAETGDDDHAIEKYEEAIGIDPEAPAAAGAYHKLAALYAKHGDSMNALELLETIVEQFTTYTRRDQVMLEMARALEQLGRRQEALEAYAMVAVEYPETLDSIQANMRRLESELGNGQTLDRETRRNLQALGYIK